MKQQETSFNLITALILAANCLSYGQAVQAQDPPSCEAPSSMQPASTAARPVLKATISSQQYISEFGHPAKQLNNTASAVSGAMRPTGVHLNPTVVAPSKQLSATATAQQKQPIFAPRRAQATPEQIAHIKAVVASFRQQSKPPVAFQLSAQTSGKQLPHWGDKDCLCHEGYRLFQAHRYLEAAAAYHKAGENMLQAWGHPNADVANALRGEAVCLSEAGQLAQARDLLKKAVDMYIRCGNGNPAKGLEDSLTDLSSTYQAMGVARTAIMMKASTARISALSRGNPTEAALEFEKLANN